MEEVKRMQWKKTLRIKTTCMANKCYKNHGSRRKLESAACSVAYEVSWTGRTIQQAAGWQSVCWLCCYYCWQFSISFMQLTQFAYASKQTCIPQSKLMQTLRSPFISLVRMCWLFAVHLFINALCGRICLHWKYLHILRRLC